jgi:hypothetical protein
VVNVKVKVKFTLRPTVSYTVLMSSPNWGLWTDSRSCEGSYGFVAVRHPLRREDRSANCPSHGQLYMLFTTILYICTVHISSLVKSPSHCELCSVHTSYSFTCTEHVSIPYMYIQHIQGLCKSLFCISNYVMRLT